MISAGKFSLLGLFLAGCTSGSKVQEYLPDTEDLSDVMQDNLAIAQASGVSIYTYIGAGLFVVGAVSFAFGFNRTAGIQLILAGAVAGAVPFIVASEYFSWITGGTLLAAAGLGIWHLWFKIKQAEQTEAKADEKK